MASRKKVEDLTSEEMLRALVDNVLRHITFHERQDVDGKPYMEVTIQVDSRIIFSRIIPGKPSSRDTFPFDLVVLEAYMKNKPTRAKAIAHEIIKHRQGMADRKQS